MLWVIVAIVALWQLRYPPLTRLRWWRAGWFSCGILAAAIAIDDAQPVKDVLDETAHWLWIVTLVPAASPLLVCVTLTLRRITRRCPSLPIPRVGKWIAGGISGSR